MPKAEAADDVSSMASVVYAISSHIADVVGRLLLFL
jgi:hypothetical protein